MGKALHTNRAASTLATGINAVVTACTVATGEGARFPAANTAAGTYFGVVIQDGDLDANLREYCRCTNRSGDVLTITRAQGGSSAQTFSSGATVAAVILASEFDVFVQKDGDQLAGVLDDAALVSIASAATTSIGALASNGVSITGATTITSLGTGVDGMKRKCYIAGGLTFTHGATLVLPGGTNLTLAAGDWVTFRYQGTAWFCTEAPASSSPASSDNSNRNATTIWAKLGFATSLAANGYLKFPDWLGGLFIQWGSTTGTTNGASATAITFPFSFPTAVYTVIMANGDTGATLSSPMANGLGGGGVTAVWSNGVGGIGAGVAVRANWVAFGR